VVHCVRWQLDPAQYPLRLVRQTMGAGIDEEELLLGANREVEPEGVLHQMPSMADAAASRPKTSAAASPLA
jgi:hypothetical protein